MKYTGERPNQLSVPNDLKFPHLLFAEETPHFRHILFENLNVCKTGGIGLQPIPPADFYLCRSLLKSLATDAVCTDLKLLREQF